MAATLFSTARYPGIGSGYRFSGVWTRPTRDAKIDAAPASPFPHTQKLERIRHATAPPTLLREDHRGRQLVPRGRDDSRLIERLLCKEPEIAYNDLAQWRNSELPHAFGCDDWLTLRVTTNGELDAALAVVSQSDQAAYVEVVTDTYAGSDLALKLHEAVKTLYR